MGLDKKFLAGSYKRMADEELVFIMTNEYKDLTDEAKEVLLEELSVRGLAEGTQAVISIHKKGLSEDSRKEYIQLVRDMPCPHCTGSQEKLNALMFKSRDGIFYVVACPTCLEKVTGNKTGEEVLLASLGSAMTIINSVGAMIALNDHMKLVRKGEGTPGLISFVNAKAGELEWLKNDKEKLLRMLRNPEARIS